MNLAIRSARPDEEAAVTALWRACGLVVSYNDPSRDFRFALDAACSDVLIGEDDTGVIRASVMVGHDGHRGWLYYVSVDPAARRTGYGRQIVAAGERWVAEKGITKLQLLVRETNTDVIGFYQQIGFETAPRVVMAKWLQPPV